MRHPLLWTLVGAQAAGAVGLGVRRSLKDREARQVERELLAADAPAPPFSPAALDGLPEPAQRYLRHAIAPATPLVSACWLEMTGEIAPTPGAPLVPLAATEALAPREGFVWTARATMNGLPVRVRDHYLDGEGGVAVTALGVVPVPLGGDAADVARSSRGRLVGEAVWCPTALVHPDVRWEAVGEDRARYTVTVDGDPVAVTLRVDADGRLLEVTLDRWGAPHGGPAGLHPYGFRVEAEGTFGGVTIPTRVVGGWLYGTHAFDLTSAASFTVRSASLGPGALATPSGP